MAARARSAQPDQGPALRFPNGARLASRAPRSSQSQCVDRFDHGGDAQELQGPAAKWLQSSGEQEAVVIDTIPPQGLPLVGVAGGGPAHLFAEAGALVVRADSEGDEGARPVPLGKFLRARARAQKRQGQKGQGKGGTGGAAHGVL